MLKPSVAVIVPVLNEQAALPELMERLKALPVQQVILVDGGSSDDSVEMLAASPFITLRAGAGRARQMNAGARVATAEILLFLHADTEIDSDHIKLLRMAMINPAVVGGRFDVELAADGAAYRLIEWLINLRSRMTRISTGDQAMFIRQTCFTSLGGFPDQPLMEDIALSIRLKRLGKVACLNRAVITSARRWQRHGVMRTVLLMWKLRFLYWRGVSPDALARLYREAR